MSIDLQNVSSAYQELRKSHGPQALTDLADDLDKFRKSINVQITDEEFNYFLIGLLEQRRMGDGQEPINLTHVARGFYIREPIVKMGGAGPSMSNI